MLEDSVVVHNAKPPLRWIANWAGSIASHGLLEISYLEDEGLTNSFKYKYYGFLWDTFWPLYRKYGTYYKIDTDMSGKNWDDYDDNGIPYWEKTGLVDPDYTEPFKWDYEDDNGDAFRVITK